MWWDGLTQDRHMSDFHFFMRDLIWLRRHYPALCSEPVDVSNIDEYNRILAFHRWVPCVGRDVVVVISLREETFQYHSYDPGFPLTGSWHEISIVTCTTFPKSVGSREPRHNFRRWAAPAWTFFIRGNHDTRERGPDFCARYRQPGPSRLICFECMTNLLLDPVVGS